MFIKLRPITGIFEINSPAYKDCNSDAVLKITIARNLLNYRYEIWAGDSVIKGGTSEFIRGHRMPITWNPTRGKGEVCFCLTATRDILQCLVNLLEIVRDE